jgi:hypothetical protein
VAIFCHGLHARSALQHALGEDVTAWPITPTTRSAMVAQKIARNLTIVAKPAARPPAPREPASPWCMWMASSAPMMQTQDAASRNSASPRRMPPGWLMNAAPRRCLVIASDACVTALVASMAAPTSMLSP